MEKLKTVYILRAIILALTIVLLLGLVWVCGKSKEPIVDIIYAVFAFWLWFETRTRIDEIGIKKYGNNFDLWKTPNVR